MAPVNMLDTRESGRWGSRNPGVGLGQDQRGGIKVGGLRLGGPPGVWLQETKPC